MKKLSLFLLLLSYTLLCLAEPIDKNKAAKIAEEFHKQQVLNNSGNSKFRSTKKTQFQLDYICKGEQKTNSRTKNKNREENNLYYVFNADEEQGFVIVSGDDKAGEVLAYSDSGYFSHNDMPDNLKSWMNSYADAISAIVDEDIELDDNPGSNNNSRYASKISPLLEKEGLKWGQSAPFNNNCPIDLVTVNPARRSVTGCVATAMVQVMRYHKHPQYSNGSHEYTVRKLKKKIKHDFNNTYNWAKMPANYWGKYTDEEANEVAKLMHDVGVSMNMNYGGKASGANTSRAQTALVKHFSYDKNIKSLYRRKFSRSEWYSLIKKELNEKRPVIYSGHKESGAGHAFVCDGYDSNDFFHINWGWHGNSDGYFDLSILNPKNQGIGGGAGNGGYASDQLMVIGIKPDKKADKRKKVGPKLELIRDVALEGVKFQKNNETKFSAKVKNSGTSVFHSKVGLVLNPIVDQKTTDKKILLDGYTLRLEPGETKTLTFKTSNHKNLKEGMYLLEVMSANPNNKEKEAVLNYQIRESQLIKLESAPTGPKLSLENLNIPGTVAQGVKLKFNFDIKNSGLSSDVAVAVTLFKPTGKKTDNKYEYKSVKVPQKTVKVASDKKENIQFELDTESLIETDVLRKKLGLNKKEIRLAQYYLGVELNGVRYYFKGTDLKKGIDPTNFSVINKDEAVLSCTPKSLADITINSGELSLNLPIKNNGAKYNKTIRIQFIENYQSLRATINKDCTIEKGGDFTLVLKDNESTKKLRPGTYSIKLLYLNNDNKFVTMTGKHESLKIKIKEGKLKSNPQGSATQAILSCTPKSLDEITITNEELSLELPIKNSGAKFDNKTIRIQFIENYQTLRATINKNCTIEKNGNYTLKITDNNSTKKLRPGIYSIKLLYLNNENKFVTMGGNHESLKIRIKETRVRNDNSATQAILSCTPKSLNAITINNEGLSLNLPIKNSGAKFNNQTIRVQFIENYKTLRATINKVCTIEKDGNFTLAITDNESTKKLLPGTYSIKLLYLNNENKFVTMGGTHESLKIKIKEPELNIASSTTQEELKAYLADEKFNYNTTISNNGGAFKEYIYLDITPNQNKKGEKTITLNTKINVARASVATSKFEINLADLKAGEYTLQLKWKNKGKFINLGGAKILTIIADEKEASSIIDDTEPTDKIGAEILSEETTKRELNIQKNSDNLKIEFPEGSETISIYDMSGRMINRSSLSAAQTEFNFPTTSLNSGIYIVVSEGKYGRIVEKVLLN